MLYEEFQTVTKNVNVVALANQIAPLVRTYGRKRMAQVCTDFAYAVGITSEEQVSYFYFLVRDCIIGAGWTLRD